MKIPIGVAEDLLSPVLSNTSTSNIQGVVRTAKEDGVDDEGVNNKRHGTDTLVSVRSRHYIFIWMELNWNVSCLVSPLTRAFSLFVLNSPKWKLDLVGLVSVSGTEV